MKIYRLSQKVTDYSAYVVPKNNESYDSDESYDTAMKYFNIGHRGDDWDVENYDIKDESLDVIWVILNGKVESEESHPSNAKTHGMLWGHDKCDKTYKGRYEPDTGQLSIVKPENNRMRDVPSVVWKLLRGKFKNIKEVSVF